MWGKGYFFVALIVGCSIIGTYARAEVLDHQKKHYLDKRMIHVSKTGITVKTKKGDVKVKTLRSDGKGVFIYRSDVCGKLSKGDHDGDLPCSGCNGCHTNDLARDVCEANSDRAESASR
jgi:hypothetical protein